MQSFCIKQQCSTEFYCCPAQDFVLKIFHKFPYTPSHQGDLRWTIPIVLEFNIILSNEFPFSPCTLYATIYGTGYLALLPNFGTQ